MDKKPVTKEIVDYAMKITSKDVRAPKCVRDGIVKRMYTEEDVREAIRKTITYLATLSETGKFHSGNIIEEAIIQSLNKQD